MLSSSLRTSLIPRICWPKWDWISQSVILMPEASSMTRLWMWLTTAYVHSHSSRACLNAVLMCCQWRSVVECSPVVRECDCPGCRWLDGWVLWGEQCYSGITARTFSADVHRRNRMADCALTFMSLSLIYILIVVLYRNPQMPRTRTMAPLMHQCQTCKYSWIHSSARRTQTAPITSISRYGRIC